MSFITGVGLTSYGKHEGSSSLEDFLEDFPTVTRERAVAVLEAARERLASNAPVV